jgi:hypothetical protein
VRRRLLVVGKAKSAVRRPSSAEDQQSGVRSRFGRLNEGPAGMEVWNGGASGTIEGRGAHPSKTAKGAAALD